CFRAIDAESGKPLSGVTLWTAPSGHYFDCRALPYDGKSHYYPPTGDDGLMDVMSIPAMDGVSTTFRFQKPGYFDASTSDWMETWHLCSYGRSTDDIVEDRIIPSARVQPVV